MVCSVYRNKINVSFCWSANTRVSITYKLVFISPAVNPMFCLRFWSFGQCRELLHFCYSQVYTDLEWEYLLGSHLWVKEKYMIIFDNLIHLSFTLAIKFLFLALLSTFCFILLSFVFVFVCFCFYFILFCLVLIFLVLFIMLCLDFYTRFVTFYSFCCTPADLALVSVTSFDPYIITDFS